MSRIPDSIRYHVWQELLDVARLNRYYEQLRKKHRTIELVLGGVLLVCATGGVANLFDLFPKWVTLILNAAIGITVVITFIGDFSSKRATLTLVQKECAKLEFEWEKLWADANSGLITVDDLKARNNSLAAQLSEVTCWPDLLSIKQSDKINRQSFNAANRHIKSKYPSSSYQGSQVHA